MLYDILSPLIFFLSLGGIILIVGRVVIRIRREQFSSSIRSTAGGASAVASTGWQPGSREVSQLLKPTQKSVHALRSRFSFLPHLLRQTRDGLASWQTRRRQARAARPVATADGTPVTPAPPAPDGLEAPARGGVSAPARRKLAGRLDAWRRRRVTREPGVPREEILAELPSDTPAASSPTPLPETRLAAAPRPAGTPPPPAIPTVTPATPPVATAAQPPAASDNKSFASSLLRRVQAKRTSTPPAALLSAASELQNRHWQAAEDVLVPYIVKHPKDTAAYMLLGQAAMGREAWEEAMEIFEQVIKWNRKQVGAYTGLGLSAYRAGHFTRALQALQRAQDTDPDNREVLDSLLSIAEKMDNPALQHSIREKIEQLENVSV